MHIDHDRTGKERPFLGVVVFRTFKRIGRVLRVRFASIPNASYAGLPEGSFRVV